jgi:hypothetical protein
VSSDACKIKSNLLPEARIHRKRFDEDNLNYNKAKKEQKHAELDSKLVLFPNLGGIGSGLARKRGRSASN